MKRKALFAAGVLVMALGVYFGSQLWKQATAQPGAVAGSAPTRVAVVNLGQVIEKYEKTKQFKEDQKKTYEPMKKDLEDLANKIKKWMEDSKSPALTPAQREQYDKAITDHKRLAEDKENNIRKIMSKKVEEQTIQLYREIEDAIQRYALSNGYSLVLNNGELINPSEVYTALNIERKLQGVARTGCAACVFVSPSVEITNAVLSVLNAPFQRAQGGVSIPPGGN